MVASTSVLDSHTLHIFPLYALTSEGHCTCSRGAECRDAGKHPMVRWRHYDDDEKGPAGDFGIPTGVTNGLFVVDVDMKDGKDGGATLAALAAGRVLPETKTVLTPTGGAHLYWKLPPGVYVPNRQALGPGLDVRGEGGYVVGPGSHHKNGGTYEDAGGELADAPAWLLDLVTRPRTSTPSATAHVPIDPKSPAGVRAIEWAKAYLSTAEPAIEGQDGSGRLFHVACHLMYSSLSRETLQELVEEVYNPRCVPPWSPREIEHKLEDADRLFEEPRGLASPDFLLGLAGRTTPTGTNAPDPDHEYTFTPGMRGNTDTTKASFGEVVADLVDHRGWADVLSFDTFRYRVVAVNPPMKLDAETSGLSDNDVQLVRAWFEYHGKKLQATDVRAAIETVARKRAFDPRVEWLKSLVWDEAPRLDRVLPTYFATKDTAYERAIGPKWFISLVARAMTPGCQSDCTLVLEGLPGKRKTSAFRDGLLPDPSWYAETTCGVDSKDFYENLRGVWIQAFDELDTLSRGAAARVNSMLTATRDRYRKSYGHYSDDYPRTCGFCGSTNAERYALNEAMARRLWPTRVRDLLDVDKIRRDRDQIWAEAFARWRRGELWYVDDPQVQGLCDNERAERLVVVDAWEEQIVEWCQNPAKVTWTALVSPTQNSVFKGGMQPFDGSQGITTAGVLEHCIGKLKGQWTHGDAMRVGNILARLGFIRTQMRIGKIRSWRYFPV